MKTSITNQRVRFWAWALPRVPRLSHWWYHFNLRCDWPKFQCSEANWSLSAVSLSVRLFEASAYFSLAFDFVSQTSPISQSLDDSPRCAPCKYMSNHSAFLSGHPTSHWDPRTRSFFEGNISWKRHYRLQDCDNQWDTYEYVWYS